MNLKVIRTPDEFKQLATQWNELLACCGASAVPFLRHEYLSVWWQTLGGGEWPDGELFIVIACQDDRRLVGIAPMFFTHNREGEPALLLLGSIEISDYLDLIVDEPEIPAFMEALLDFLNTDQAPAWQVLDWYNIPEASPTLPALKASAEQRGWVYTQERLQPCPSIPLPGDWENYLGGIDKKQRHEIRRKMRRAEEYERPVRWYIAGEQEDLDQEIEAFMTLMAQEPEKERFLTEAMRAQMRSAIHAAHQAGWLQLSFLEIDGQKVAGYLNFDYDGHIWVYNSGLGSNFRELSPGWVLLGYLLKWANENQRKAFDFMRGSEDYKYRFGAIDHFIARATVRRNNS